MGRRKRPEIVPIAMLTYKRPDLLERTIDSFIQFNRDYMDRFRFFIFVQQYDLDTLALLRFYRNIFDEIILSKKNVGFSDGLLTVLDRAAHRCPYANYLMILEDDWESYESLGTHLDKIIKFFESNPSIGYIRLRTIHQRVFNKNAMTKERIKYVPVDDLIYKGNMHFSANPTIFRKDILQHFKEYGVKKEAHMVQICHYLGECGAQLRRDCFWHIGLTQRTRPWRE